MTSVRGDYRRILGLPEEGWFEKLAASTDWTQFGFAPTPDLDRLRHDFLTIWSFSREDDKLSFPRVFEVDPYSAAAQDALEVFRAIGADEVVALIEAAASGRIEPQAPDTSGLAPREAELARIRHEVAVREYEVRKRDNRRDVREALIGYLRRGGIFPLEPEAPEPANPVAERMKKRMDQLAALDVEGWARRKVPHNAGVDLSATEATYHALRRLPRSLDPADPSVRAALPHLRAIGADMLARFVERGLGKREIDAACQAPSKLEPARGQTVEKAREALAKRLKAAGRDANDFEAAHVQFAARIEEWLVERGVLTQQQSHATDRDALRRLDALAKLRIK